MNEQSDHSKTTKFFPSKFGLTIEESNTRGWYVTSDAHKGFLHFIPREQGLADGLREVPMALRTLLIEQMDADRAKGSPNG